MPGALLEYGTALRTPIDLLHWAGTETATRWSGYMDGAVESGQRAAAEVVAALSGTAPAAAVVPASAGAAQLPNTAAASGATAAASLAALAAATAVARSKARRLPSNL
jgi:hypothetical protein